MAITQKRSDGVGPVLRAPGHRENDAGTFISSRNPKLFVDPENDFGDGEGGDADDADDDDYRNA